MDDLILMIGVRRPLWLDTLEPFCDLLAQPGPGKLKLIKKEIVGRRFAPPILNAKSDDPFGEMLAQNFGNESTKASVYSVLLNSENNWHRLTALNDLLLIDRLDRRNVQDAGRNSLFRQVFGRVDAAYTLGTG
jgi:hypothetical protein